MPVRLPPTGDTDRRPRRSDEWFARWSDLTEFEVYPVIGSAGSAMRVLDRPPPPAGRTTVTITLLPAVDVADGQVARPEGASTHGVPLEATLADLRALATLEPVGLEGVIAGKALFAGAFTVQQALATLASA